MRVPADIVLKRDDTHQVWGWAVVSNKRDGTPLYDLQGDHVALPELEACVYEAVGEGIVRAGEQHRGRAERLLIESMVWTPQKRAALQAVGVTGVPSEDGWWMGQQLTPDTYQRVKLGDRLWFSIEGHGEREALCPHCGR
jgi:Putative phage serine protease XkdF